jgi:primosomal protein N' (replication factor Y)
LELERRRALRYPPFSHLSQIALAGEAQERVEASAETVRGLVAERLGADDDLLGPAPLFRLRGRHRRRLVVKSERRHETVEAVRDAVASAVRDRALRQVSISVDVDPQ